MKAEEEDCLKYQNRGSERNKDVEHLNKSDFMRIRGSAMNHMYGVKDFTIKTRHVGFEDSNMNVFRYLMRKRQKKLP
jgi:hypothetical protein